MNSLQTRPAHTILRLTDSHGAQLSLPRHIASDQAPERNYEVPAILDRHKLSNELSIFQNPFLDLRPITINVSRL